jgi:hypothetical protein
MINDTSAPFPFSNGRDRCVLTYSWPSGNVVPHVRQMVRRLAPASLWPCLWHLFRFLSAIQLASRSFVGHMRILLAEKFWSVELGHPLVFLQNGSVIRNNRTAARTYGTRQLRSRYPWASLVDHKLFLEGFDLGEAYARHNLCIPESEFVEIGASEFPAMVPSPETLHCTVLPLTESST